MARVLRVPVSDRVRRSSFLYFLLTYGLLYVPYYFDRPIDNPVEVFIAAIVSIALLRASTQAITLTLWSGCDGSLRNP